MAAWVERNFWAEPGLLNRWALSRWRHLLVNRAKRSSAVDRKINGLESSNVVLDPSENPLFLANVTMPPSVKRRA